MMMMSGRNSSRFPFTATQWEELQNQVLIFKYMVLGIPIPSYLLFTIKTSFLEPHQHDKIGWNCGGEMRMVRKVDPEPGRCRRTDGKKWRCSKLAYTDSKYCERHMHRGKNRSRKHVEEEEEASTGITMVNPSSTATQSLSLSFSSFETHASTEKPTLCLLGSSSYRLKQEVDHEPCGTRRSFSGSSMEDGTSWQLQSLKQNKHDQDDGDKRKPKRKIHRFIDEWPPKHRDSWLDYDDHCCKPICPDPRKKQKNPYQQTHQLRRSLAGRRTSHRCSPAPPAKRNKHASRNEDKFFSFFRL